MEVKRSRVQMRTLSEQATWEVRKLARMVRFARRRGDRTVCERLLSQARTVQRFVENQQYPQALHAARCRLMG